MQKGKNINLFNSIHLLQELDTYQLKMKNTAHYIFYIFQYQTILIHQFSIYQLSSKHALYFIYYLQAIKKLYEKIKNHHLYWDKVNVLVYQIELSFFITMMLLKTMPTFVSTHMFCTSGKVWFKHHAYARVNSEAINYATQYTTKLKAKFSYLEQIKFNELVLKPGIPKQQHITRLTCCYLLKIILKFNCKRVPADGIVCMQNECEICNCFTQWGGDRKKCNGHRKVLKKDQ